MLSAARLVAVLLLFSTYTAAAGPGNILIVVNEWSAVSKAIGEYYARKRAVPQQNVCRIRTGEREIVSRDIYRQEIAKAVSVCLTSRRLTETVLYIVTTIGVPLRVAGTGGLSGDYASVDSELTLLYSDLKGREHSLNGPLPNLFFERLVPFGIRISQCIWSPALLDMAFRMSRV